MPTIEHILFIPGVLLLGFAIGFRMGARSARAEYDRQRKRRRE